VYSRSWSYWGKEWKYHKEYKCEPQGPFLIGGGGCVAVNGREDKFLSYGCQKSHPPNCIATTDDDVHAWWLVDMEKRYTLTSVKIMDRQRVNPQNGKLHLYTLNFFN
jgi:hypothetical protein